MRVRKTMSILLRFSIIIASFSVILSFQLTPLHAGVFTLPQFLDPGATQVGLEPEFIFTNRGGPGIQGRIAYGVNDLSNFHVWLGTGSEPRKFRTGGLYSFDFIPDIEGQIGAGIAVGAQFLKQPQWNRWDVMVVPYLHEGFISADSNANSRSSRVISSRKTRPEKKSAEETYEEESPREDSVTEPYFAMPLGYAYRNSEWVFASSFVIGSLFHINSYITYVMEFGVNVNYSETYLSGGFGFQF